MLQSRIAYHLYYWTYAHSIPILMLLIVLLQIFDTCHNSATQVSAPEMYLKGAYLSCLSYSSLVCLYLTHLRKLVR
jgi:hypothetical protein